LLVPGLSLCIGNDNLFVTHLLRGTHNGAIFGFFKTVQRHDSDSHPILIAKEQWPRIFLRTLRLKYLREDIAVRSLEFVPAQPFHFSPTTITGI
jgi:hypothetical protein